MRRAGSLCRFLAVVALVLTAVLGLSHLAALAHRSATASARGNRAALRQRGSRSEPLGQLVSVYRVGTAGSLAHRSEAGGPGQGPGRPGRHRAGGPGAPEAAVAQPRAWQGGYAHRAHGHSDHPGRRTPPTPRPLSHHHHHYCRASALLRQGTVADLEDGTLEADGDAFPRGTPAEPGAYLLVVEVTLGGEVLAGGADVGGQGGRSRRPSRCGLRPAGLSGHPSGYRGSLLRPGSGAGGRLDRPRRRTGAGFSPLSSIFRVGLHLGRRPCC